MEQQEIPSRWASASVCSRLTFSFVNPILALGIKRPLGLDDLAELAPHDKIPSLTDRLQFEWNKELTSKHPSLWQALYRAEKKYYWLSAFYCLGESATRIGQPVMLGLFLEWLTDPDAVRNLNVGLLISFGLASIAFVQIYVHHLLYFYTMRGGWNARLSCTALIHRKLLRVHSGALGGVTQASGSGGSKSKSSDGNIVNLVSNDVFRFDQFFPRIHFGWSGPFDLIVCFFLIVARVGWLAAAAGVSFIVLLLPVQLYCGTKLSGIRKRTASATDARVQRTSEVFDGILTVKASVWEDTFGREIASLREIERASIFRAMLIKAFNAGLHFCTPYLATLFIFVTFWAQGNVLSVSVVFSTLSLVHVLRLSLGKNLTFFIESLPEAQVSVQRIRRFLLLREKDVVGKEKEVGKEVEVVAEKGEDEEEEGQRSTVANISLADVTWAWGCPPASPHVPVVKNITWDAHRGDLVVITGPTGCGKTAMLKGLVGELDVVESSSGGGGGGGGCVVKGTVAVVNQIPWIMSGSLRDNIVWSSSSTTTTTNSTNSESRFQSVLERCGLKQDLAQWEDGVETRIGEKGVNLSGGQRARVSLARAVYSNRDIVLLDGVLSAVDPSVASSLLRDVVLPLCREEKKIVVVSTHLIDLCRPHADVFVRMDVDGCIVEVVRSSKKEAVVEEVEVEVEEEKMETVATVKQEKQENVVVTTSTAPSPTVIITKEEKVTGGVRLSTYWNYLNSAGSLVCLLVLILFVSGQTFALLADVALESWSGGTPEEQSNLSSTSFVTFVTYTGILVVLAMLRSTAFYYVGLRGATVIHGIAFRGVLNSPMSYFTSNPLGRILNKFSSDLGQMDEALPSTMHDFLSSCFLCVGCVVLSIYAIPWIAIPTLPLVVVMLWVRNYFLHASRALKRCESVTKSPVFVAFSTNMSGRSTIRAYGNIPHTIRNFEVLVSENGRAWFNWLNVNRWVGFRLDAITLIMLTCVVVTGAVLGWLRSESLVAGGGGGGNTTVAGGGGGGGRGAGESSLASVDHGLLAIAITYCIQMSGIFQYMVRLSAKVETQMIAVERLSHLTRLESEHVMHQSGGDSGGDSGDSGGSDTSKMVTQPTPLPSGTSHGHVELRNISVRYRADLPLILKNVDLDIPSGTKVGVCGRTGSGKSTLMLALSRLNLLHGGDIYLDGVSSSNMSLKNIRSSIGVIPQIPTLFAGTLRYNVDPTGTRHDDDEIKKVLDAVGMRVHRTAENGLDVMIEEDGKNLSVGEKQCVSLARACLLRAKTYVVDEATANIDHETDMMIQKMLREHPSFAKSTVVVVAHRLSTISDVDMIVVMDNGRVAEMGAPSMLMAREGSMYREMVEEMERSTSSVVAVPVSCEE